MDQREERVIRQDMRGETPQCDENDREREREREGGTSASVSALNMRERKGTRMIRDTHDKFTQRR